MLEVCARNRAGLLARPRVPRQSQKPGSPLSTPLDREELQREEDFEEPTVRLWLNRVRNRLCRYHKTELLARVPRGQNDVRGPARAILLSRNLRKACENYLSRSNCVEPGQQPLEAAHGNAADCAAVLCLGGL